MKHSSLQSIQKIGNILVDIFHYLALFAIGAAIVRSAIHDYLVMMKTDHISLEEILLLFIYLELTAMISIYFKTHRLSVQYLIYIAITALSRHLVIDVREVSDVFHLHLLMTIAVVIAILSGAILVLSFSAKKFGVPNEEEKRNPVEETITKH